MKKSKIKIKPWRRRKRTSIGKIIAISTLIVILAVGTSIAVWVATNYDSRGVAQNALISNENLTINEEEDYTVFLPVAEHNEMGVIIYPGAKVDMSAYAPLGRAIAENGYQVVLVEMPLDFPILGANRAEKIIARYPEITSWTIVGHSLGGVMASNVAAVNETIEKVIFLASYPMNEALKEQNKEVLSIWGTLDGVLNFEALTASKTYLPEDTQYVEIEGGNHAQFGDYGPQSGDFEATITAEEQVQFTTSKIIEFLN